MKTALFAVSNHWTSPFQVGSHMLARGLVHRGWRVGFVSHPLSPFHAFAPLSSQLRDRWTIYRQGGVEDLDGRLWAYVPFAAATYHRYPMLRTPWLARNWHRLTMPNVIAKARGAGFSEVDLLYFDNGLQNQWLDSIGHRRSVFRLPDQNAGYKKLEAVASDLESELSCRADAVFCTAPNLLDVARGYGAREARYFPNGVQYHHFADDARPVPEAYAEIPRPRAVYVGEMGERFDFKLVAEVATRLPSVSFVLIGPPGAARRQFEGFPNVFVLGTVPYSDVPPFVRFADVGLIPFRTGEKAQLLAGVNPLKLYQYMAAGLPVVATFWPGLHELGSPAHLASSSEEFASHIAEVTARSAVSERYREFAKAHDWGARLDELEAFALAT